MVFPFPVSISRLRPPHGVRRAGQAGGFAAALLCILAGCAAAPQAAPADPAVNGAGSRTGIYDSRAVAIAWVRSDAFRASLRELTDEHARATASGDSARAAALEARGAALQARIHRQGFGTEPVDDVLERVAPELSAVRERTGAATLLSRWDPSAPAAGTPGTVDVTDDLVALFHPDEETLRQIAAVRARRPER